MYTFCRAVGAISKGGGNFFWENLSPQICVADTYRKLKLTKSIVILIEPKITNDMHAYLTPIKGTWPLGSLPLPSDNTCLYDWRSAGQLFYTIKSPQSYLFFLYFILSFLFFQGLQCGAQCILDHRLKSGGEERDQAPGYLSSSYTPALHTLFIWLRSGEFILEIVIVKLLKTKF